MQVIMDFYRYTVSISNLKQYSLSSIRRIISQFYKAWHTKRRLIDTLGKQVRDSETKLQNFSFLERTRVKRIFSKSVINYDTENKKKHDKKTAENRNKQWTNNPMYYL